MEAANRKSPVTIGAFNYLAVAWLTMFVVGSDLFVLSPLLPLIAADYAVPPASAGFCVTIFAVAYMLSAPVLEHESTIFLEERAQGLGRQRGPGNGSEGHTILRFGGFRRRRNRRSRRASPRS